MKKRIFTLITVVIMIIACLFSVSCGEDYDEDFVGNPSFSGTLDLVVETPVEKIIYYYSEIDVVASNTTPIQKSINTKLNEFGGYVDKQSEKFSGKRSHYCYMEIYVPTEKALEFIDYISSDFELSKKMTDSSEITSRVVEARARYVSALETRQRYKDLLAGDTLSTSERITVIGELEEIEKRLAKAEVDVDRVYQEYEYSKVVVKIGKQQTNWQVFWIVFAAFSPIIVPLLVAGIVFVVYIVRKKKKAKAKATTV